MSDREDPPNGEDGDGPRPREDGAESWRPRAPRLSAPPRDARFGAPPPRRPVGDPEKGRAAPSSANPASASPASANPASANPRSPAAPRTPSDAAAAPQRETPQRETPQYEIRAAQRLGAPPPLPGPAGPANDAAGGRAPASEPQAGPDAQAAPGRAAAVEARPKAPAREPAPGPTADADHATPPTDARSNEDRRRDERRADWALGRRGGRQDGEADAPAPVRKPDRRAGASPAAPAAPRKPTLVAENAGLEVETLGKTFKKRPVLRDVSLSVQRGEAVGLLGPNGAGKTTCFYIITGLIPADYGAIRLDGRDITDLPMYRRSRLGIGYLPQEASIFRGLTVEQNILAVLELIEKDRARREAALEGLMAEFSISHLRRTPAIALSGGERRRLEIARALASQPHFVLLDEPLAGIDPIAVRDIRELVSHLKDRGIGVLITDHNVRETLDIVDRAYILHNGTVLMEGAPDAIVANQEVRRVYLGDRFSL